MAQRLNANAFEFVPRFGASPGQAAAPPAAPIERPAEDAPAPPKPPTISLNIGGPKPAPAAAAAPPTVAAEAPQAAQAKIAPTVAAAKSARPGTPDQPAKAAAATKSATGFNFSMDKAATDSDAVAKDVTAAVDQETLEELYGKDEPIDENIKQHLNIVFIGHVDAGKSTMGGNILYLCGMVDKRTMEKYEREAKEAGRDSWYLSWALDSTPQERAKGKTVEVGRAYFETEKRRYTILDAPGHKTYVPSMISGAAQADVAVLVISARKGEFETGFERSGQTREHIMLVKTVGVSKVVVAINKMDDATVEWNKERYDEIKGKLAPFIKQAGFNLNTDVTWIPLSAYTGVNLKDRADRAKVPWVEGPSLLEHLDTMPMVDRKLNAPLMIPVSEKYKDMGTIVVGKIESGRLRKGDTLLLMPNRSTVDVAAIYNEMEEEVPGAISGDNVRIRLRGVDDEEINPGFVLTSPSKPVHAVRQFEAHLAILDHKNIICAGYQAVMHVHTLAEEVTLGALLHYFDKKTNRKSKKPPQFAKKGQRVVALVEATAPVCVERFSDYPQLGRFTLRDEGKTIAIGRITKLIESSTIDEAAEGVANLSVSGAPTA
ncbi:eukaryotic polypeptide chain release factor 3 [Auriculariales sp. MPI-PUGE-AT-0066]|nr:eukaryotic polypeptide chain release factor 3 [Auriculariales sp. MPI-PUGE-AT-0066]